MTTQPPSPDAVEAALVYAKHKTLTIEHYATLDSNQRDPWESSMAIAARILAAEVERLREQNKRQGIEIISLVGDVAEIRSERSRSETLYELCAPEMEKLRAEVERLRAQADAVCEWQEVEETNTSGWYYETECEKEYEYNHEPKLTNHPHCPGCGRKVKITTNE